MKVPKSQQIFFIFPLYQKLPDLFDTVCNFYVKIPDMTNASLYHTWWRGYVLRDRNSVLIVMLFECFITFLFLVCSFKLAVMFKSVNILLLRNSSHLCVCAKARWSRSGNRRLQRGLVEGESSSLSLTYKIVEEASCKRSRWDDHGIEWNIKIV